MVHKMCDIIPLGSWRYMCSNLLMLLRKLRVWWIVMIGLAARARLEVSH